MPRWLSLWFGHFRPNQGLTSRYSGVDESVSAGLCETVQAANASGAADNVAKKVTDNRDSVFTGNAPRLPSCNAMQPRPESNMTSWGHVQSSSLQLKRRQRFLVVEDEQDIADLIALHLSDLNADVTTVQDGGEGLDKALHEDWDAILLDIRLPNLDGLDICRTLRAKASYVPIMMLTSRSTELDRVLGLEIGADDYMVKPFSVAELKARVKALVRRSHQSAMTHTRGVEQIQRESLFLDRSRHLARLADRTLDLTAREFDLLWHFASHPGKVFKRSELLDQVWGYGHDGYEHTVNSHINRLRSKLEKDPGNPYFIETIWGVGYKFKDIT